MKFVFVVIFLTCSDGGFTQNRTIDSFKIDSLKKILLTQKEDSNKVNSLVSLSKCYVYINIDSAFEHVNDAIKLAQKISFNKGEGYAWMTLSQIKFFQKDFQQALSTALKALAVLKTTNRPADIAKGYLTLGYAYTNSESFAEAIKSYYSALRIYEAIRDKTLQGECLFGIGGCSYYQEDYQRAFVTISDALQRFQEAGDGNTWSAGQCNVYLANIHLKNKNYERARYYDSAGLNVGLSGNYFQVIAEAYACMGNIFTQQSEDLEYSRNRTDKFRFIKQALDSYKLAAYSTKSIGDLGGLAENYVLISESYIKLSKLSEAQRYADSAAEVGKLIQSKNILKNSYRAQSKIDSSKGDYRLAYLHYKLSELYKDSLLNEENTKKSLQHQMQYEFDKKQDSIKAVQDKKDALASAEIKNQKLVRNFSLAGAIAVVSFGGYSFYRYRRRRKLQSQQEMLNERLRISRELHDDIGSTLGSISIYSEVAKNRSSKNENAEEAISKIGVASRELIEKMSDIVWSINPNNESFEQLQNRMQTFAAMTLAPRNIQNDFLVDEELKNIELTSAQRKNIFLIFKEAIHNIIKYADCEKVEISLLRQNDELTMRIKDDGKGFDIDTLNPETNNATLEGNGLKNMQARARDINASLDIRSEINEGTAIQFFLTV